MTTFGADFGTLCNRFVYRTCKFLTLQALKVISIKFLLVISMLYNTDWWWELWTWSHKINLLDILSTSPHIFCRKWVGQQMRIQILILGLKGLNYKSPYVRESRSQNLGNFCSWNLEFWTLESGIKLKESRFPLTIWIWNPSSTDSTFWLLIWITCKLTPVSDISWKAVKRHFKVESKLLQVKEYYSYSHLCTDAQVMISGAPAHMLFSLYPNEHDNLLIEF